MLPVANPSVIFQKLDDGAVLFTPATETYFGLNEVGAAVWTLLPPRSATLDDLCARVSALYPEVPLPTILADVGELLDRLVGEGLAHHAESGGIDAAAAS